MTSTYLTASASSRLVCFHQTLSLTIFNPIHLRFQTSKMATNQPPDQAEQAPPLPNGTQPDAAADDAPPVPAIPESRLPTRKDTSLKELLSKMDDYAPIVRLSAVSKPCAAFGLVINT